MRRFRKLAFALLVLTLAFFLPPLPSELEQPRRITSLRIVDRRGELLREVLSSQAGVSRWVALSDVSPWLVQATLISEDSRFFWHPGVDPVAWLRAAGANLRARRIVEGGSTLSQQLVRNLTAQRPPKLTEIYWALRLDFRMTKLQILEAYLNRIPYGMQAYGCEAAARTFFGKPAKQLSLAESAFLAVLPRSPEGFRPFQDTEEVQRFQSQLLDRMASAGAITAEQCERAKSEPLHLRMEDGSFLAPHFCDWVLAQAGRPGADVLETSLDARLQKDVEDLLRAQVHRLESKGVDSGAVVVLEVASGDILAMVGSPDYGLDGHGQFNAALAGRQPGSTLKPFTYSLALEKDKTASSLLPDLDLYPVEVERGFLPTNYDGKFHGPVRLRTALACSYNVPVVRVLEEMGNQVLLHRLQDLGFSRLTETPEHYGLGLTLGDGEVSLLELATAYRALARGGRFSPAVWTVSPAEGGRTGSAAGDHQTADADAADRQSACSAAGDRQVIDPRVAYLITDILKDHHERMPAFGRVSPLNLPFECAVKTGTSKAYRDNWTVGYTPRYVVAVWIGASEGTSLRNVSGVTGAGPLFRDVMLTLEKRDGGSPSFPRPHGLARREICELSGDLPGPLCAQRIQEWYLQERQPAGVCSVHRPDGLAFGPVYHNWMVENGLPIARARSGGSSERVRIAFPDGGSVFRIDPVLRRGYQQIHFRAIVPEQTAAVDWSVGPMVERVSRRPFDTWRSLEPGEHQAYLTAYDAQGRELGQSRPIRFLVR